MLLFKRKYIVSVSHIIDEYEIKFTKLINNLKTLEKIYNLKNIKIYIKTSSNIKKEDYIALMKSNHRLSVNHSEDELLAMNIDEVKKLYDINEYEINYNQVEESNYSDNYSIQVSNKTFKKKRGKFKESKSRKYFKHYKDFESFFEDLKLFKEVDANINISVNEKEISLNEYLKVINVNSNFESAVPKTIKTKECLITYLRDLSKIREILD